MEDLLIMLKIITCMLALIIAALHEQLIVAFMNILQAKLIIYISFQTILYYHKHYLKTAYCVTIKYQQSLECNMPCIFVNTEVFIFILSGHHSQIERL